ncbi:MAG: hypothetical protein Crog4KO_35760 [Crocinitomicaceae bacterium]
MAHFSSKTLKCLRDAGWNEEYQADLNKLKKWEKVWDCKYPPVVERFYQNFGELEIKVPKQNIVVSVAELSRTQYIQILLGLFDHPCETKLAHKIGESILIKVGEIDVYEEILMDSKGRVFTIVEGANIRFLSTVPDEAIELLCAN